MRRRLVNTGLSPERAIQRLPTLKAGTLETPAGPPLAFKGLNVRWQSLKIVETISPSSGDTSIVPELCWGLFCGPICLHRWFKEDT